MSPATPSDRRPVTVCQWASKKIQVTTSCMIAIGSTMISRLRPNSEVGSQRLICRGMMILRARTLMAGKTWASVRRQAVAHAAHGLQVARVLGIVLDLAAQAGDLDVDGPAGDVGGVAGQLE